MSDLIELIVTTHPRHKLVKEYLEACEREESGPEAIAFGRIVQAAYVAERSMIAALSETSIKEESK